MADPIESIMKEYDYSNFPELKVTEEYNPSWITILSLVLQSPALVAGLLANILLLVVFASSPRLITGPNVLFLQRAIVDLLFLLCVPQFMHFKAVGIVQIGLARCKALSIVVQGTTVATLVFLMAYTLDGYLAANPQQHSTVFRRSARLVTSAASWALAVAAGIAASVLTHLSNNVQCSLSPIFDHSGVVAIAIQMFLLFLVPLVVVWVFVGMTLNLRSSEVRADPEEVKDESPNRRLLLGLASTFTVLHGIYWIVSLLAVIFYTVEAFIVLDIASSLSTYGEALNPILVLYLSEELRQKVVGWLPFRRSPASVPLRDIRAKMAASLKSYDSKDPLVKYTADHSLRFTEAQKNLMELTFKLPKYYMLGAPEVLQLNANLIRTMGGKKVLDVGVYTGASALSAALALPPDGEVHALDLTDENVNLGRKFWSEDGVADKIHVHIGPATDTLQQFIDEGQAGTFDFAFIDADKPNFDRYYEQCLVLVRRGGIIAFDNTVLNGRVLDPDDQKPDAVAVRKLNKKLRDDQRIYLSFLKIGDGLSLCFIK
ncbi:C-C chemokine receptor type 1-like isoform X1 [Portunus trituberculatus]|uniref:C-C chemokine receptor type 1-like isoform X1 n=1 Tax=Portunus trituberculatus TaxID=210409 RepID=UPI001E1D16FF|nr:C-C chemokine receptor type 1-like isoform X1 [Portunus trituberculatus]